jgi:hypothetical protein
MADPMDVLADPESRWDISGTLEINCLGCHSGSPRQDQSEWAKQMARENYRWAATAASGLGEVGGMACILPDSWALYDMPDPDDLVWAVPPSVNYDAAQIDGKGQVVFDIVHKPKDERCLYCHSVSPVGKERPLLDRDVHSRAGIQCVDCHRNGLDHRMVRGYPGEKKDRGDTLADDLTCEGCHGGPSATAETSTMTGRLGAPRVEHKGLPAIHFEKLACTACHSGPRPGSVPEQVRTSRANRLGIYGVAKWFTEAPYIVEPVFIKGGDGKIAPYRMVWPAFWGRLDGETVTPLPPEEITVAAEEILDAEQRIGNVLAALSSALVEFGTGEASGGRREAVFLTPGKVYHRNIDGGLSGSVYSGTMTVEETLWVQERDGVVLPLLPEFDPESFNPIENEQDSKAEECILAVLRALSPDDPPKDQPVLALGNKIFRLSYRQFLEPDSSMPQGDLTEEEQRSLDKKLEDLAKDEKLKSEPYVPVDGRIYRWKFVETLEVLQRTGETAAVPEWGWFRDGAISPLVPEFVVRAVVATVGSGRSFTEEQVEMVLKVLSDAQDKEGSVAGEFVYVCSGKLFRRNEAGRLEAVDHPAAEPYAWPLGHDVRPRVQSLGANSTCTDCHSTDAPFFFGKVPAMGPLQTDSAAAKVMHEFENLDVNYERLFGLTFRLRPTLKIAILAVSVLLGGVLLAYLLTGLRQLCKFVGGKG